MRKTSNDGLILFTLISIFYITGLAPFKMIAKVLAFPVKINASQIPIGANWTYFYPLNGNSTCHVYCYGKWIDYDLSSAKTDYDIFVYDPLGEMESYHTEAAGLPEHLGTTVDQPLFTPKQTGNYSFLIKNDHRKSQGAKEATFMLIEHVECNKWYRVQILGLNTQIRSAIASWII